MSCDLFLVDWPVNHWLFLHLHITLSNRTLGRWGCLFELRRVMIYLMLQAHCPRKFENHLFSLKAVYYKTLPSTLILLIFCFCLQTFAGTDISSLLLLSLSPFHYLLFFFTLLLTRMTTLVVNDIKELLAGIFSCISDCVLLNPKDHVWGLLLQYTIANETFNYLVLAKFYQLLKRVKNNCNFLKVFFIGIQLRYSLGMWWYQKVPGLVMFKEKTNTFT